MRVRETSFLGRVGDFGKDLILPGGTFFGVMAARSRQQALRNSPEGQKLQIAATQAESEYQNSLREAYILVNPGDTDITEKELQMFEDYVLNRYFIRDQEYKARIQDTLTSGTGTPDANLGELRNTMEGAQGEWLSVGDGWVWISALLYFLTFILFVRALGRIPMKGRFNS